MKNIKETFMPLQGVYCKLGKNEANKYNSVFLKYQKNILDLLENFENKSMNCDIYKNIEKGKPFIKKWDKASWEDKDGKINQGGNGKIGALNGRVFEKAGVNYSNVKGKFSDNFIKEIPGADESNGEYNASGLSVIVHPRNPLIPAIHMNIRVITTSFTWVGGVIDLNPMGSFDNKKADIFHSNLKDICDEYDKTCYLPMAEACDNYFYIKHRKRNRGIGGIFFDYLPTKPDPTTLLTNIGEVFCKYYSQLCEELYNTPWTKSDTETQQIYRGYYAEYNLVYDRGTKFGFSTDGNTEAILMSLPPTASWPALETTT